METKSEVETREVERTGTLRLVRIVDFDKIANQHPGATIPKEALQTAGTYAIEIQPNGRGAEPQRVAVASAVAGKSWLDGFEAAVALKKKGPRKPTNGAGSKLARNTKPELLAMANKLKIPGAGDLKKPELIEAIEAATAGK